jgi:hypothetical protein
MADFAVIALRGKEPETLLELTAALSEAPTTQETDAAERSVNAAIAVAARYAGIDGAHHKQWVIDQMLRSLMGTDEYASWRLDRDAEKDYEQWDEGVAP